MLTRVFDAVGMPNDELVRELTLVLLVKLTVIALAAIFIFGPNRRPHVDAAKVQAHVFGAAAPASPPLTQGKIVARKTAP